MSLANKTPEAVAMLKATAPKKKIPTDLVVKNTSAWVLAPTVNPRNIVAVSMIAVRAVHDGQGVEFGAVLLENLESPHDAVECRPLFLIDPVSVV